MVRNYIAYYRVSTEEQGKSGLGKEAQRQAVLTHINGNAKVIKEFEEDESGTKDRPELNKAIQYCKDHNATLIVSKMDRLARSIWLFENFKREGIDFEIVGLPKNPLVQSILMSVAEWEAKAISDRTKSALAVKKAQGFKLGSHNPRVLKGLKAYWSKCKTKRLKKKQSVKKSVKPAKQITKPLTKRELFDKSVIPQIKLLKQQGFSYKKIASALNKASVPTRQGGKWSDTLVFKIIKRNNVA